ncbi:MAG: hypothetical protein AAB921_01240 [Patescibacteria group bacterium]
MRKLVPVLVLSLLGFITGLAGGVQAAEMPKPTPAITSSWAAAEAPSLVAVMLAAEPAVRARPRGHKFCDAGTQDAKVLGDRIAASLKVKADGSHKVEGCRVGPLVFLRAHQANDPENKLGLTSVDQLPDFYRHQVELVELPPGTKYWSGCVIDKAPFFIAECVSRVVGANGEKVWRHKASGKIVLLGNCANPVGRPDPPKPALDCDSMLVYLPKGYEPRIGMLGHTPVVKSACLGLKRPGEDTFDSVLLDRCPRDECDFSGPSKDLGLPVQPGLKLSFVAETEGWYELRFDRTQLAGDNALVVCVIRPSGEQSLGKVTTKNEVYNGVAYITASSLKDTSLVGVRKGFKPRVVQWTGTKVAPPTPPQ